MRELLVRDPATTPSLPVTIRVDPLMTSDRHGRKTRGPSEALLRPGHRPDTLLGYSDEPIPQSLIDEVAATFGLEVLPSTAV